jgi:uncharacterized membrane protein YadS
VVAVLGLMTRRTGERASINRETVQCLIPGFVLGFLAMW